MSELLACPLDYRYGSLQMRTIFAEEGRLGRLLEVEAALARSQARLGIIPRSAATEIGRKATTKDVKVSRVKAIEKEIQHDLMAVVKALTEKCSPEAGRYVHYGATSYDIIDCANALMLRSSLDIVEARLIDLMRAFARLAKEHRDTVCVGRSHGQHAVPMTFGLKIAVFLAEARRHLERLREARGRILVGKVMGAVGTGAGLGPKALEIQRLVAADLGIGMEEAATQIVQRDRYNELLAILANLAASLEKFATEVRNLQRNEIGEVAEGFDRANQVGSSTMAQKRNPVRCERISGLARVVRALLAPAYENSVQWHERDLSNSSGERVIIPHALILTDHILSDAVRVFNELEVYPEAMRRNLLMSSEVMAESVVITLTANGMGRQDAHEIVRTAAMAAEDARAHALAKGLSSAMTGREFRDSLLSDKRVSAILTRPELDEALRPESYVGVSAQIVDRVLKNAAPAIRGKAATAARVGKTRRRGSRRK
ncbi:MAG: adenylosuccinate lyase [Euryarchaeota archaeon]|nr:adenylosuccinate lyase [Euryarchaeota archaeon]